MNSDLQYYSQINPEVGELVLVQFTELKDDYIEAKLLEYPYIGIMNYHNASKKRRVSSWKKIIPLNKNMVAKVDEIDERTRYAQLSLTYLDNGNDENTQNKLMEYFNENKIMESFIKSLCIINNYEYNLIWTKLIHHIDYLRREYNEENEENISLWKYFNDNIDNLCEWLEEVELDEIYDLIMKLYEMKKSEVPYKISSKIGIISMSGIDKTKEIIQKSIEKLEYEYSLRYDTAPYYLFESHSKDSLEEDHQKFIKEIESNAQKSNSKIFVKVDFCSKKIY
jgi:translation initiation factor 2 alpha subunit (eIF-2alpha)